MQTRQAWQTLRRPGRCCGRAARRHALARPCQRPATPRAAAAEEQFSNDTKLRGEAQAPFRVFRQFLLSAFGASATIGFGVSFIQFTTGLAGAPSAPPVLGSAQNLAIDAAVGALCLFFWRRDEAAKGKALARISRESALGALRLRLADGRGASLAQLRGFARVVIAAGGAGHVSAALQTAAPFKEALLARGVLFVPVVVDDGGGDSSPPSPDAALPPAAAADLRWRADPASMPAWRAWLRAQMGAAGVAAGSGVYVSLRLDGRVRASGVGLPPWALLASSLPPTDGVFGGFLDGMDGSVASE